MESAVGAGLTFTSVVVSLPAAGRQTLLAPTGTSVQRLHAMHFTMDAAGSVGIYYDDDGAGTSEVSVWGPAEFATKGGVMIEFGLAADGIPTSASSKYLTLVASTSGVHGGVKVSKATS
ncbi:hypothetical protein LCGC14_0235920 [marine sediment metagenome]|uniref:Uncharacterized protein n=1 Tax=marine sediment metagenome TaxID=412755 RepID=A0A0F9WTU5_9ZZZZ